MAADRVRILREALAPSKEQANLVGVVSGQLAALQCAFDDYKESAYLVDKDSYKSKKKESKKKKKDTKSRRGRGSDSKSKSSKQKPRGCRKSTNRREKNKCNHCKESCPYAGKHEANKCFYNKKYKGWQPRKICKELDVTFKRQQEFLLDMGGFASSASEGRGSNSSDSNSSATSNE